jgi:hypothetical protein
MKSPTRHGRRHRLVETKPGTMKRSAADELREREAQRREAAAERMRLHRALATVYQSLSSRIRLSSSS